MAGRPFTPEIITPDMVPPSPQPDQQRAVYYTAQAIKLKELYQQLKAQNDAREGAAQSVGFDEGHVVNRQLEADYDRGVDFFDAAAKFHGKKALLFQQVSAAHDRFDREAHEELAGAKNAFEEAPIIARWHGYARAVTANAVAEMNAHFATYQSTAGSIATELTSRLGAVKQDPVLPDPGSGNGITVPVDNKVRSKTGYGDDDNSNDESQSSSRDAGSSVGPNGTRRKPIGDVGLQNPAGDESPSMGATSMPGARPYSPEPSPTVRQAGLPGGGGIPSGGGLGSGGMSGLGGAGSPLSSLTSGLGGNPAGSVSGLGGVSNGAGGVPNAAASAGEPGASFSRGLSAGSGLGGAVSPLTSSVPGTTTGSAATGAGGGAPSVGVSPTAAGPTTAAASGAHVPAATAPPVPGGAAAAGLGSPMPMLAAPGMSAPAAPVAPSPGAPVMPAGSSTNSAGSAGVPPGTAVTSGNLGATLIPASVVAPIAAAANVPRASNELRIANSLAWQLQRDTENAQYFGMEWAVGVFRSESGTEAVVHSNEGFGYIPAGVCIPRSARLLQLDPLVDIEFRQRWFGWYDSARVLVEYAELRRADGWALVAAASSGSVEALRRAGVEHSASCTRDNIPTRLKDEPPAEVVDTHVHRLQACHADIYERIQRVVVKAEALQLNRVIAPAAAKLWDSVRFYAVDVPEELYGVWDLLSTHRDVPAELWDEQFRPAYKLCYGMSQVARPGYVLPGESMVDPETDRRDRHAYLNSWLAARLMELVGGWKSIPIALADMAYAAGVSGSVDVHDVVEAPLRLVENEVSSIG